MVNTEMPLSHPVSSPWSLWVTVFIDIFWLFGASPVAGTETRIREQEIILEGDPMQHPWHGREVRQRRTGTDTQCGHSADATVGSWHLLLLESPGRQEGTGASELSTPEAREQRCLSTYSSIP